MSKPSGSITGLGIRNKAGGLVGRKDSSSTSTSSSSKPSSSITGLGLRDKAGGLMGKGKGSSEAESHQSRPLSTLKDPNSFGPPPRTNYTGSAVVQSRTNSSGLGAPLSRDQLSANRRAEEEEQQREEEEAERARGPRRPYQIDTTGLSTSHLPPPPGRRDGADGRMAILPPPSVTKSKPPGLPPRLPPRTNSNPTPTTPQRDDEPDAHKGMLNQGALNRLGSAGISVAGFEIQGRKPALPPPPPSRSPASSPQVDELQSRFSKLSTSSTSSLQSETAPAQGTTWAQKQAALKTASSFRNDPSSISFSDAKAAAGTANNFRERHGEQVKSGMHTANRLNTKYGLAEKAASYGGGGSPQSAESGISMRDNTVVESPSVIGKKKPPPPPPKKKASLAGAGLQGGGAPPPVPLSTRPPVSDYDS